MNKETRDKIEDHLGAAVLGAIMGGGFLFIIYKLAEQGQLGIG